MLHFIGASIILINGLSLLQEDKSLQLSFYLQIIIAAEIYLVLFLGRFLFLASPELNIFCRIIESFTLVGIGLTQVSYSHIFIGCAHLFISAGYFFLFYREWRIMCSESINIRQTGITIPNFIKDEEIGWPEIRSIIPRYHSINIETFSNKRIQFQLRKNLKIEELQQINEFCRQHLAADGHGN
jgi:hypothetical protein